MAFLSVLRDVVTAAGAFGWLVYGVVTLVRRRREESVREFTKATATGLGLAFGLVLVLVVLTWLI